MKKTFNWSKLKGFDHFLFYFFSINYPNLQSPLSFF